ncbi:hypothetical protein CK203_066186 [Vitis vinifera]|uniref:Uncharacterized protein n=1 Tax=Vitis vinifera TaxID=29760 RepID=A0A438FNW2_VITVI|nr:hypothetical protein CK203_066186 [Vitis vinifera]
MIETSRDWSDKLSFALWAYRTSFRTSTGATPYSLIPEADWAQARFDQLNLLDERKLRAADHVRAYQRKMAHTFKKRVKPKPLHIGDLVLRVIRGLIKDPRGKFKPSWSGPYFIKELIPDDVAWLMDLDGNQFSELTNVDQLKSGASLDPFSQTLTPWHQMIPCHPIPDLLYIQCYTGAYIRFRQDLQIFTELHAYPHLRDISIDLHDHPQLRDARWADDLTSFCLDSLVKPFLRHSVSRFDYPNSLVEHHARPMESLSDPSSGLRFAAACHTAAYFPLIFSLQFSVQSHHSFTVYDIQSHHVTLSVRRSEPLLQFCEFRATIISQFQRSEPPLLSFGVQSHHYHFSFNVQTRILSFRSSELPSLFSFGIQNHHRVFSLTFKVIIITSQFQHSEPSLSLSVSAFKAIIVAFQFRHSEPSSV